MSFFTSAPLPLSCAAVLAVIGCDIFNPGPGDEAPEVARSIVSVNVAADWSEGNTALYSIDSNKVYTNLMSIDGQNSLRTRDGAVFILEWAQCEIIKITGSSISRENMDTEEEIGNATNIHDIAFAGDTKAYVTQFGAAAVVLYNPSTGRKTGGTVDLSAYSPDGASNPAMDRAVYFDGKVYVGLQKWDNSWQLTDNSSVAVIDTETDEAAGEIVLDEKNPQGMSVYNGMLYIACTGVNGVQDGGIEVIDLASGTTNGVLVDEVDLGGDVSNVLVISETRGYAVAGPWGANTVVCFNPESGEILTTLSEVENAAQYALAWDGSSLYVGDRSATSPGLLIFDPSDNSLVSGPHDLGMPPNGLAVLEVEE